MRQSWATAGRDGSNLSATAFALGCVLKDGESAASERAMAQAGPRAAVILHRAADEALSGLPRSEEHTSELQSLMRISYAVFCLKKKKHQHTLVTLESNYD